MILYRLKILLKILIPLASLLLCVSSVALGQTTAFTYQGKLTDGGNPANGSYDLQFALFDISRINAINRRLVLL